MQHHHGSTLAEGSSTPEVCVTIEIPRWSCLKRGSTNRIDFISPLPCPYNYGAVHSLIGLDGDYLDAIVLGPRLRRGEQVTVTAFAAIGLTDRGMYDDKLICSVEPPSPSQRAALLRFFRVYARGKGLLNLARGQRGEMRCEGWSGAGEAIRRARPVGDGSEFSPLRF